MSKKKKTSIEELYSLKFWLKKDKFVSLWNQLQNEKKKQIWNELQKELKTLIQILKVSSVINSKSKKSYIYKHVVIQLQLILISSQKNPVNDSKILELINDTSKGDDMLDQKISKFMKWQHEMEKINKH